MIGRWEFKVTAVSLDVTYRVGYGVTGRAVSDYLYAKNGHKTPSNFLLCVHETSLHRSVGLIFVKFLSGIPFGSRAPECQNGVSVQFCPKDWKQESVL